MDKEGSPPQVERPAGSPAAQADGLAQLLRGEEQLANDRALLLRGEVLDKQVAEPEESATLDDMDAVHQALEAVANAICQGGGEAMNERTCNG